MSLKLGMVGGQQVLAVYIQLDAGRQTPSQTQVEFEIGIYIAIGQIGVVLGTSGPSGRIDLADIAHDGVQLQH